MDGQVDSLVNVEVEIDHELISINFSLSVEKIIKKQKEAKEAAAQKQSQQPQEPAFAQAPGAAATKPADANEPALPNKILFIQNLPQQTTMLMVNMLFQQFPG